MGEMLSSLIFQPELSRVKIPCINQIVPVCLKKLGKFSGARGGAMYLDMCLTVGRCCPNSWFFAFGYARDNKRKLVFFVGFLYQFDTEVSAKISPNRKNGGAQKEIRKMPAEIWMRDGKGPRVSKGKSCERLDGNQSC